MHFITRLTIQKRLKLLVSIPLLFLLVILANESVSNYAILTQAEAVKENTSIAGLVGEIIRAAQKERAATDAFMGSNGQKARNSLSAQRAETDTRINALKGYLAQANLGENDFGLLKKLQDTLATLSKISGIRQQVDSQSLSGMDAFSFYTRSIRELISTLQLNAQNCLDPGIGKQLAAHYNFAEAKERMNIEKVLMTNTFAYNEFANLMFMKFAELLAEQKIYLENFLTFAESGVREFHQEKMRDSAVGRVEAFRNIAVEKRFGGGFNINPERWSEAMTKKIGLLEEVENRLTSDFAAMADNRRSTAISALTVKIGGGVGTLIISVVASLFLSANLVRSLTAITTDIKEGTHQVSSAAHQLAASSQTVAESSSRQAAAVEETSASMEEMSAMIKRDAENTAQADSLMKEASQVLGQADGSMKKLTGSMEEINSASIETQKIVKTIDEIAFQTNLLALNAAVEAARAGEAGAGFAVVADEVRNLAMRAAEAAGNTSMLIEGTVHKVKAGAGLVSETNHSFDSARQAVEKIAVLLAEIAAASREEADAVHQVNEAISHIDQATQENAASAEESASAAEELSGQAGSIQGKVLDLMALVGGKEDSRKPDPARSGPTGRDQAPRRPAARTSGRTAPPKKNLALSAPAPAKAPAAKSPLKASAAVTPEKKQDPAAVIPFDDDDFQDF